MQTIKRQTIKRLSGWFACLLLLGLAALVVYVACTFRDEKLGFFLAAALIGMLALTIVLPIGRRKGWIAGALAVLSCVALFEAHNYDSWADGHDVFMSVGPSDTEGNIRLRASKTGTELVIDATDVTLAAPLQKLSPDELHDVDKLYLPRMVREPKVQLSFVDGASSQTSDLTLIVAVAKMQRAGLPVAKGESVDSAATRYIANSRFVVRAGAFKQDIAPCPADPYRLWVAQSDGPDIPFGFRHLLDGRPCGKETASQTDLTAGSAVAVDLRREMRAGRAVTVELFDPDGRLIMRAVMPVEQVGVAERKLDIMKSKVARGEVGGPAFSPFVRYF